MNTQRARDKENPKVSILIPCYNAERWIAQAIESAIAQTYKSREVIVVDDGSTDESLEIIKGFGDRIVYQTGSNQGGNVARNQLLALSRGEWIQYLDADDYLLPDKVELQMRFVKGNPQAEVVYSPHITEEMSEQDTIQKFPDITTQPEQDDLWLRTIRWQMPQTGGLLIKRQSLIDINGWRQSLNHCQDYDLYVRLLQANKRFVYCQQTGAVYRWWCSGTVTHRNVAEIYRDRLWVQNEIENHLIKNNELTGLRQDALNQARFEYARRIYAWDKPWASQVAATLSQNQQFEPSDQVAPSLYRTIYKIGGFRLAESVADIKRKLWK